MITTGTITTILKNNTVKTKTTKFMELDRWSRICDPNKKLQKNNYKLMYKFYFGDEYSRKTRGVIAYTNPDTKEVTYYARLYNSHIAKRSTSDNKLYITHGGWPTRTTARAINALLPVGWRYSRQTLISPNNARIEVTCKWVLVEEPVNQYTIRGTI